MKRNAILIHGTCDKEEYYSNKYPTASNSHWFPWLSKQLIILDIPTVSVEMPNSYMPNYSTWKKEFERFDITPETILIGHSCGGGFLIKWLSQNKDIKVNNVILVAPWLDPHKSKGVNNDFFDFEIDENLKKKTKNLSLFVSSDDEEDIQISVKEILNKVKNIKVKKFKKHGHFCIGDMKTDKFIELLNEAIK